MCKLVYQAKQKAQFDELEAKFKQGLKPMVVCDRVQDYINDPRRSLTTAFFTPPEINQVIQNKLIEPLRAIDPNQYYLPPESLHLNLLILAYNTNPPTFTEEDAQDIKQILEETLPNCPPITYTLKGILVGPNSLAVRGYTGIELQQTVRTIQKKLLPLGFDTSIGQVSKEIFFGNVTFCRFTHDPSPEFLAKVMELKHQFVGKTTPSKLHLISSSVVFHLTQHKFYATISVGSNLTPETKFDYLPE